MLIDGEKWACEACVRGHRVTSCRHHDRPLIRINKKGRPFSVCCICRGPCKDREEHSKLNRDRKSDGESDSKSSGKKPTARRRIRPSSFARIAPHPAPLPSSGEPFTTSQSRVQPALSNLQRSSPPLPPTSSASSDAAAIVTASAISTTTTSSYMPVSLSASASPPFDASAVQSSGAYILDSTLTAATTTATSMGYPYVTLPIMEEPLLQPSSSAYPFSDDLIFTSMSDGGFVPDSMYTGFEDVDALPEDWSTFFWNE